MILFLDCLQILHPDRTKASSEKLGATFNPRIKYVVHYMNLALYLKLGMILTKVHRVLSFRQSCFSKSYIDQCTEKRKESKTNFGKRLWKLFANSVFGKFIERTRGYLDCKIVKDQESCEKWLSSPRLKSTKILNEDLVIFFLNRQNVTLNKAFPIGFTILEMSKNFMYEQFYRKIRPALGNCQVIMSDTDSFVLLVQSEKPKNSMGALKKLWTFRTILHLTNFTARKEKTHWVTLRMNLGGKG